MNTRSICGVLSLLLVVVGVYGFLHHFTIEGHNWGSEHDPDNDRCSPSAANGGKHIMYTYAVDGFHENNRVSHAVVLGKNDTT